MHIRNVALVAVVLSVWAGGADSRGQCMYDWLPGQGLPGLNGYAEALTAWDPDGAGPQPEILVAAGVRSRLALRSGFISLVADVIPLEPGHLGQQIRVRMLDTGRIARARVDGRSHLEAKF